MATMQELFDQLGKLTKDLRALQDAAHECRSGYCTDMVSFQSEVLSSVYMPDQLRNQRVKDVVLRIVEQSGEMASSIGQLGYDAHSHAFELEKLSKEIAGGINGMASAIQEGERKLAEVTSRLKEHAINNIEVRDAVWQITGGKCFYCDWGLARMPEDLGEHYREFHVDHIVARANGGPDHMSNYVPACASCNISKGAKSFIEFTRKRAQLTVIEGGQAQTGT